MHNFENIKTVADLAKYIIERMPKSDIEWAKSFKLDECGQFLAETHLDLGRSIRNNCELWDKESYLYNFMYDTFGLTHPDDQSGIILAKIFFVLHETEDESWVKAQTEHYKNHWKLMEEIERNGSGTLDVKYDGKQFKVSVGRVEKSQKK